MDRYSFARGLRISWPAAAVALALAAVYAWDLDRRVAGALFYDEAVHGWIGADTWWAFDLIHEGGAWLIRSIGLTAVLVLLLGFKVAALRPVRRAACYVALALALCPAVVGTLKQWTDVHCPRDLAGFGGRHAYLRLFDARPAARTQGRCFPGSHASTGFSLMAFYFVIRKRRPRIARGLLAGGIALGTIFSIGQQARGAHFLSHDLTSAAIAWYLLLGLQSLLLESAEPAATRLNSPASCVQPEGSAPPRERGFGSRDRSHPPHARRRRAGIRSVLQCLLRARVPLCPAPAQWRRRSDP